MAVHRLQSLDDIEFNLQSKFTVVEEDTRYPQQLAFQAIEQASFRREYPAFLTNFNLLRENSLWEPFLLKLEEDGYEVYVLPSAQKVLESCSRFSEPLKIENFQLSNNGQLYWYQQYGLRKALESTSRVFFFGWGTGSGKGIAACAGSQELFNRNEIDLVLVFTMRNMKINLVRFFENTTQLSVRNIEGDKSYRQKEYAKNDSQVYSLNYEKANFDCDELKKLVKGKRVLFVLDEVQKVLAYSGGKPNLARKGLTSLFQTAKSCRIWPMSASVINQTPERFWRIFDMDNPNPLGTLSQFRKDYTSRTIHRRYGRRLETSYEWDLNRLTEVSHRIAPWTHTVRKSDPGVRELFKDTEFIPLPVQMSRQDRELYQLVLDAAKGDFKNLSGEDKLQYYNVLRYICNTPEALLHSQNQVASLLTQSLPDSFFTSRHSEKFEMAIEKLEEIRDQGDKAIVFTQWTNLSLFPFSNILKRRNISFIQHHGGMKHKDMQLAQDTFKSDNSITVFLSSDAGSHGLSFQEARHVLHLEVPYSYDLLLQRNDRIDRADSYLEGLTMWGLYNEDTVEERIFSIMDSRRRMSAAVQGTTEVLGRNDRTLSDGHDPDEEGLSYLLFGS